MCKFAILFALLATVYTNAHADDSSNCYSDWVGADQHFSVDLSHVVHAQEYMWGGQGSKPYQTYARAQLLTSPSPKSNTWWNAVIRLDFLPPKIGNESVSLPYQFYAVGLEVPDVEGGFSYFNDLTHNCTQTGPSLYPGDVLDLPELIHLPRVPKGTPPMDLHMQVWGTHF